MLPTVSNEGVVTDQRWQVADLVRPLCSIAEECDKNQWVCFNRYGGLILSLETGQVRHFTGRDGSYEIDMWVPPSSPSVSGFPRQGL